MRIGISCYPTYGGSGVLASELALNLVKDGHSVHVLSYELPARLRGAKLADPGTSDATAQLHFHHVAVRQYPLFDYPPYSLALANEMVQVARQFSLDLMHVHYAVPNAVSALLAQQILLPQRLPVVTTLHGTDITLVGNDTSYLETTRWSIEASDAVTAVSPWLEAETRAQFGSAAGPLTRPIEVIPNFVEAKRFASCTAQRGEEPVLVHVSNFRRVKRTDVVVAAFAALRAQRPCRLRMVGEGPERESAMAKAQELGVANAIEWLGNAPQIEKALDGCALFLLASRQESFGLAALEAMAAGLPVVCTRVGGLVDVVRDGETGRLVVSDEDSPEEGSARPSGSAANLPAALAAAAADVLSSDSLWHTMSEHARNDAGDRFSAATVLQHYLSVYRAVLANGVNEAAW